MTQLEMPTPPPLPQVGDLDWGPQVNAALVWLYEQHVLNMQMIRDNEVAIAASAVQIAAQANQIEALQGEITALENQIAEIAAWESQITAHGTQIAALENQIGAHSTQIAALQVDADYVYDAAPWTYHNAAPPALAGQVRVDTTDLSIATVMDLRLVDLDGADRSPWFKRLSDTSMVRISDWDDSSRYHRFRVGAPAVLTSTNAQFPVIWVEGSGSIASNQKADVGFFIDVRPLHPLT